MGTVGLGPSPFLQRCPTKLHPQGHHFCRATTCAHCLSKTVGRGSRESRPTWVRGQTWVNQAAASRSTPLGLMRELGVPGGNSTHLWGEAQKRGVLSCGAW